MQQPADEPGPGPEPLPEPTEAGPAPVLRRSDHLSFFHRGPVLYAYHDLYGYILEMDRTVFDLLATFDVEDGHTPEEVRAEFGDAFRPEAFDHFVETFRSYACLVPPGTDEEEEALGACPVRGPWVLRYEPAPDEVVIGYKDRRRERVVLHWLDPIEERLFDGAEGQEPARSLLASIREEVPRPDVAARVREALFRWTHSDAQVLKLVTHPILGLGDRPPYVRSAMPYDRMDPAEPPPTTEPEVVDLDRYHREEIEDAALQFDIEETTLSHLLRQPHPALDGRTYGGAFCRALREEGALDGVPRVLEVGGGVGFFARGFLEEMATEGERVEYAILDLSVVLQDAQRMLTLDRSEEIRFVLGRAGAGPFRDGSFDVIVSNEMVADLRTVRVRREDLEPGGPAEDADPARVRAARLLQELEVPLEDAPDAFWVNLGAMEFLEEVHRLLRPGGRAYVVEYGDVEGFPVRSSHLDHAEFSIQFAHLRRAADRAGLEADLTDVVGFLEMDPTVEVLEGTRTSFQILRTLARRRGVKLEKLAYTREMLAEACGDALDPGSIDPLPFRPIGERALSLRTPEFKVLKLRKPAT